MKRYFADLSFKGTNYHGWQRQDNAHTVQEEIELALSKCLSKKIEIVGAGRTDTGVHAKHMVAHFELDQEVDLDQLSYKLNAILPVDIAIKHIKAVSSDFHARFSALSRTYRYLITDSKDPFNQDLAYYYRPALDLEKMNEAVKDLLGKHDFSCFSKSNTQTFTNDCHVQSAIWRRADDGLIIFEIKADRFLRNMVRAIVGTCIEIGEGKRTDSIAQLIASKDRKQAGYSVPAEGLYLYSIDYPEEGFI